MNLSFPAQVWRGEHAATGGAFVLKRMFLEKGGHVREAAAREVFFGEALRGARGVAGFVEHFRDARRGFRPPVRGVPAKLRNSRARSNRRRFG